MTLHFGQKKTHKWFWLYKYSYIVHPRQSFVNFCSDKCGFPKGQYNFGGLCLAIYYPVELRLTHRTPEHISSWSKYFHSMVKQEILFSWTYSISLVVFTMIGELHGCVSSNILHPKNFYHIIHNYNPSGLYELCKCASSNILFRKMIFHNIDICDPYSRHLWSQRATNIQNINLIAEHF